MSGTFTLIALAFGLSVDAFAAALGKGTGERTSTLTSALRIGFVFAAMEAIMPVVGYLIGMALSAWVAGIDHWVAFILLSLVGIHMIWQAFKEEPETIDDHAETAANGPIRGPRWIHLGLAAVATSIDATVVGVSLAMVGTNLVLACLIIFGVTLVMCTMGALIGRKAGDWLGHWAEVAGGIVLIIIGALILTQHLSQGI
ncbi:manganese efflux pump MntP family protein [Henriciella marina]|uniref:Putative manganese efflux pump MntP n=1 Tax=Henriciella marina TaxID=453851 RepID=A0ABT4LSC3_9PROT|nr:manganese efflux pump MntP family protein [Henriciella marina]MCZ4297266.1 manganese efflux pump MntP family protein [Henriciella marina]